MITSDADGRIVIKTDDAAYCLDSTKEYTEFLLWITSPDPKTAINEKLFDVDKDADGEIRETLLRYSNFLKKFLKTRTSLLEEWKGSFKEREAKIDELLASLKGES